MSFPGIFFCPCVRLEAIFRAAMDFPACATKRPGNALKTPCTHPNCPHYSNLEVANKLTGVLTYTPASHSIADYTSNQHTAIYRREVE